LNKIVFIFLILILSAASITGCGGSSGNSDVDQTETSQTEQPGENTKSGDTTGDDCTDGLGDLLSSTYVEMMKNNEYMMKYKTTMDFEGQSTEMETTMAVSGDNTAVISKGGGFESTIIIKDDNVYMVDHTSKTVMTWAQTQEDEKETFDMEGIAFLGSGKEDGLTYEEYSAAGSNMKYYFDGKNLVKISAAVGGQKMVMEILEMSETVPAGMFEIPAGYQVTEM